MDDSDLWDDVPGGDEEYPEWFKFENAGDRIIGTYVTSRAIPTDYGQVMVIEVLEDSGTSWSVLCAHANLKAALKKAHKAGDLKSGARMAIRFDGMGQPKPGQSAPYLYTVEVKAPEATTAPAPDAAPATVEPQPAAPTPTASLL